MTGNVTVANGPNIISNASCCNKLLHNEVIHPLLVAFGRGYGLPCCPHSNAFETAMHAYHHLENGKNLKIMGRTWHACSRSNSKTQMPVMAVVAIELLKADCQSIINNHVNQTGKATGSVRLFVYVFFHFFF